MSIYSNENKFPESSAGIKQSPELFHSCTRKFDRRITIPLLLIYFGLGTGSNAISFSFTNVFSPNFPSSVILKNSLSTAISLLMVIPFLILLIRSKPKWVISTLAIVYGVCSIIYSLGNKSIVQDVTMFLTTTSYRSLYYCGITLNKTPMQIVYIIGASLTIIGGIISFFLFEEWPEKAKFLTEEERKNAIEVLSSDRGLIFDVKARGLQILKGFKSNNVYMTSIVVVTMNVSALLINSFYMQLNVIENTDGEYRFNLFRLLTTFWQISLFLGSLLLLFTKPIKRINKSLSIMFGLGILFLAATILVSKLTKQYIVVIITGFVMILFYSAIQTHIFALLFTFTNDPNTRIFMVPALILSESIIELIFAATLRFRGSETFYLVFGPTIVLIPLVFSYFVGRNYEKSKRWTNIFWS
ncbi:hypothetical protein BB559_006589 [Furculomyces boomerangus]|uniref:Uncharacterized protein n=1 Tax=Furculomyces boomerangus TaxID=61424 RepID=A0A2T9Y1Q0_9FUNG|nr:hypothetical protein BB559_006589 [Furculomyces boomerangus]